MIVVSDTSPVLCLAYLDKLFLLQKLFKLVIIPDTVYHELINSRLSLEQKEFLKNTAWIKIYPPLKNQQLEALLAELDYAEAEAIALAKQLNADYLLIDEDAGRRLAISEGVKIMGVIGILIEGKKAGLIDSIKPLLNDLRNKVGFHISDKLYEYIIGNFERD